MLCHSQQWYRVGLGAQGAIEATIGGLEEAFVDIDMTGEQGTGDMGSRVSTKVTFNSFATLGFFHSLIYHRLPTSRGQPLWNVTMIMDVRSLDTPKARKTGTWMFCNVGTVLEEYLVCAYHEKTKLLAYSVCLDYMDKSQESHRWYLCRLCLSYIGFQEWDIDLDPRGTFITSKSHDLSMCLSPIQFHRPTNNENSLWKNCLLGVFGLWQIPLWNVNTAAKSSHTV
jgi:hypothetical protein